MPFHISLSGGKGTFFPRINRMRRGRTQRADCRNARRAGVLGVVGARVFTLSEKVMAGRRGGLSAALPAANCLPTPYQIRISPQKFEFDTEWVAFGSGWGGGGRSAAWGAAPRRSRISKARIAAPAGWGKAKGRDGYESTRSSSGVLCCYYNWLLISILWYLPNGFSRPSC